MSTTLPRVGDRQMPLFDPEVLREKLKDACEPGFQVEFSPHEAEAAGAFVETALSEEDALESATDLLTLDLFEEVR